jgi:hypothetical protein
MCRQKCLVKDLFVGGGQAYTPGITGENGVS